MQKNNEINDSCFVRVTEIVISSFNFQGITKIVEKCQWEKNVL